MLIDSLRAIAASSNIFLVVGTEVYVFFVIHFLSYADLFYDLFLVDGNKNGQKKEINHRFFFFLPCFI